MEFRKSFHVFIMILSLTLFTGCAAVLIGAGAGAGAGTVAYVAGELKAQEEVSLNRAWNASVRAMEDLEFTITSKEKDAFNAKLTARGAGDKKIQVKLKKQVEKVTEIRIRIGVFGDESMSRQILEKIKGRC